jgi:hypothetical protein
MAAGEKTCVVIAPIGETESPVRKRSDQILKFVIEPAVKSCGYEALRADRIAEPGLITTQVIQHVLNDPMVIADLTGRNPNVYYELAIRHAIRKPYVQIIQEGELLPFDITWVRTIAVNYPELEGVDKAKTEIISQIKFLEESDTPVDSSISVGVTLEALRRSANPEDRQLADVFTAITELRTELASIEKKVSNPLHLLPPHYLHELIISAFAAEINSRQALHGLSNDFNRTLIRRVEEIGALLKNSIANATTSDERIDLMRIIGHIRALPQLHTSNFRMLTSISEKSNRQTERINM